MALTSTCVPLYRTYCSASSDYAVWADDLLARIPCAGAFVFDMAMPMWTLHIHSDFICSLHIHSSIPWLPTNHGIQIWVSVSMFRFHRCHIQWHLHCNLFAITFWKCSLAVSRLVYTVKLQSLNLYFTYLPLNLWTPLLILSKIKPSHFPFMYPGV